MQPAANRASIWAVVASKPSPSRQVDLVHLEMSVLICERERVPPASRRPWVGPESQRVRGECKQLLCGKQHSVCCQPVHTQAPPCTETCHLRSLTVPGQVCVTLQESQAVLGL